MSDSPDPTPNLLNPDPKASDAQGDPAPVDEPLGDGGKKALDAERAARKAAEKATTDLQTQLDAINRANESALEKAQREANEAREAATVATAESLRYRVAAKHGISEDDAELFLTGTDADTLERQAARLADKASAAPKPDLSQGGSGGAPASDPATSFANLIQSMPG